MDVVVIRKLDSYVHCICYIDCIYVSFMLGTKFYIKIGKSSENTGGLIYQDLCPLTLPYIIYNNAI